MDAAFIVGGFGKTETRESSQIKLKTEVRFMSNSDCGRIYAKQQTITLRQICALGDNGKDSW